MKIKLLSFHLKLTIEMSPSKSPTEENRTIEEMTGEECYELISEPVWDILWCLIIGLHSLVLGNIIYKVRSVVSNYNICHSVF